MKIILFSMLVTPAVTATSPLYSRPTHSRRVAGFFTSPLLWFLIFTTATLLVSFSPQSLHLPHKVGLKIVFATATIAYMLTQRKALIYEITLVQSIVQNTLSSTHYPWWNQIIPRLYLGALPLENKGHVEALQRLGITHFVSLVEPFEMQAGMFSSPIQYTPEHPNILLVPTADYTGSTPADMDKAVDWMHTARGSDGTVYVHCKAGKGRSATLVACYLHKYRNEIETLTYLKDRRPLVQLNKKQLASFEAYREFSQGKSRDSSHVDTDTAAKK